MRTTRAPLALLVCGAVACAACSRSQTSTGAAPSPEPSAISTKAPSTIPGASPSEQAIAPEAPLAAESNPPGDIPDSVQFVEYTSQAGGYALKVPEGWARRDDGSSVTFTDRLISIGVVVKDAAGAPTPETVRAQEEPEIAGAVRAFKEVKVQAVTLPAGAGVLLRYQANSDPDPVTGKQVRLEVDRYEVFDNGRLGVLTLSAPAGSDNVDVWRLVSRSVRWTS